MAPNATNPTRGRTARVIHWLFPSRWEVAIGFAADLSLMALGLPPWLHLALSVVIHAAAHLVRRLK